MLADLLIEALWFILPAYIANSTAPDVAALTRFRGKTHPIDGEKKFRGQRVFGEGKSWEGLIGGVLAGTIVGAIQMVVRPQAQAIFTSNVSPAINLPTHSIELAFLLAFGALAGDIVGSFLKRRVGMPRGSPAPLLDQLDFVYGAVILSWLVSPIRLDYFGILAFITLPIHLISNIIAWRIKIKKEPW
ncbi:CDP-archaeol synthase [uncultured archaeon]|nr:CDP-archaeol synthase [uncultured archaeon]